MVTFESKSSIDMFAFRFVAIGPFLAEIKQIPYLTLKNLGQGRDKNRPKTNNRAKNERNPKSCSKVIARTRICGQRRRRRQQRTNRYKDIKSPPVYRGDLVTQNFMMIQ